MFGPLERGIDWPMTSCWEQNTDGLLMLSLDWEGLTEVVGMLMLMDVVLVGCYDLVGMG